MSIWLRQPVLLLDTELNRAANFLGIPYNSKIAKRMKNIASQSVIQHHRYCEHDSNFSVLQPITEEYGNCPWYILLNLISGNNDPDNIIKAVQMYQEPYHNCCNGQGIYNYSRQCIRKFAEVTRVRILQKILQT